MPHRVHTSMQPVQPTGLQPPVDSVFVHTQPDQLPPGDNSKLSLGQHGDPRIQRLNPLQPAHSAGK